MSLDSVQLPCHEQPLSEGVHAANGTASSISSALITRQLHANIRCLDHSDRRHPGLEVQLVDCFASEQRDEAMRTGLNLHLRGDPVLDDARDDARKAIAR
jgi:hypothetical protein